MWPAIIGAGIGAAGNIIGGLMGKSSADDARAQAERLAAENIRQQREFAQYGLTWKIDDAMRNADKVHPIYSLGSSGASYTPVSANFTGDTSMANAVSSAGQNIGRAVSATATQSQRETAFTAAARAVQLEGAQLDNELKKVQLASEQGRLRQVTNPPFPGDNYLIPGQTESGGIKPKALEVAPGARSQPSVEQGSIADAGYARTTTGWAPVPSNDVKQRIEDNLPQEWMHFYRNNILPSFGQNMAAPPFAAPSGKSWWFNTFRQEYQLLDDGERPTAGHYIGKGNGNASKTKITVYPSRR